MPTNEEVKQLIRDMVKPECLIPEPPPPPTTDLIPPTYEGIVLQSTTSDVVIFSPPFIKNSEWWMYGVKDNKVQLIRTPNGLNTLTITPTNAPAGSFIYTDRLLASAHKWYGAVCNSYYYGSTDGINWDATAIDRTQYSGEDRNIIYDNGIYKSYIRVQPKPRTIGYSESTDFRNWSKITEILKPSTFDNPNQQFYHMSVIKTNHGYFGLLNVYMLGSSGQDVEQNPPYTGNEHTIDVQLAWSENGKDNWIRLNDRKNFIQRKPDIKQLFGWWSVIGDTVYIYTTESKRRHTTWDNAYNFAGNAYFACRYKILLNDLYKYKN